MGRSGLFGAVAWVVVAIGCPVSSSESPAKTEASSEIRPTPRDTSAEPALPALKDAIPVSTNVAMRPLTIVTEREVLDQLDGLDFGTLVFGRSAASMAELATEPGFSDLLAILRHDLVLDRQRDPKAGVGMRYAHRQFDIGWLEAENVHLDRVAVVNRLDRQPFAREHCGETRIVYRLAYRADVGGERVSSRLPMTINVVFWQDGACTEIAQRWLIPSDMSTGAGLVEHLARGPLASVHLGAERLKSVEINLQSVRWPAAVHPGMAGHAEYTLRAFRAAAGRFEPMPLENTPDIERLRTDDALRDRLLVWLRTRENLQAIDRGTALLPQEFLAQRAQSVTPRGFARLANRPFRQLFALADFEDLEFAGLLHVHSARGLLRRLDGLTCGGCHESRSVAGFHVLGEDLPSSGLDALVVSVSPHLTADLPRREAYVSALARGGAVDDSRPPAERESTPAPYGAHCGLGDPSFEAWTCAPGLECTELDDEELGTCLPRERSGAGSPCEVGQMRVHADPHRDRVTSVRSIACDRGAVCNSNGVGFPQGMCTLGCMGLEPDESCGAIVALHPFNLCVGRGRPFPECVRDNAHPAGMRRCGPDRPCRDDYICARAANDTEGACLPPYFLFQLRVDGHVM